MIDSKSARPPASRRVLRRIGAVLAGMILIVMLDIGLDVIMHATGIYPPWFQPMASGLWLLAIGYRMIDTTALAEGLHTISWTVTDSRPATAGLGSRYFTVANSADAQPAGAGSVTSTETLEADASDVAKPLSAAPAPDMGLRVESVALSNEVAAVSGASAASDVLIQRGEGPKRRLRVSHDGGAAITLAPMERIELTLGPGNDDACPSTWAGYLVKDNVLSTLPVGSSLEPSGTFYWQTGPGFAGTFPLLFVQTNCRGEKQRVPVTVTIPIRKAEER